jgi:uncharacterized protein (TIGR03437 family)
MPLVHRQLALLLTAGRLLGDGQPAPRVAPFYTAASIVNAADNQSGQLAPNAIGTIYGTNLAYSTAAISAGDIHGGVLPILLGASETTVIVGGFPAALFYVSPLQINFLVPPNLLPGAAQVYVDVDFLRGAVIPVTLGAAAPGLFQLAPGACQLPNGTELQCAVATRADGSVLTPASPAMPGDIVVLWATGLGPTTAPPGDLPLQIPTAAWPLAAGANFSILLDGVPVSPSAIYYAGQAPDFAGLYQVNLTLPLSTGPNPEIRLQAGGAISVPNVHLPVVLN